MASKVRDPVNYFLLLRALFRSIGGGKFELLYKVRPSRTPCWAHALAWTDTCRGFCMRADLGVARN